MTTKTENKVLVPGITTSTNVGWYKEQPPNFGNDVYDLLEKYSKVKKEDAKDHILKIVGPEKYFTSYFADLIEEKCVEHSSLSMYRRISIPRSLFIPP